MKLAALIFGIAASLVAVVAAALLTKGGAHIPWSIQSYDGTSC